MNDFTFQHTIMQKQRLLCDGYIRLNILMNENGKYALFTKDVIKICHLFHVVPLTQDFDKIINQSNSDFVNDENGSDLFTIKIMRMSTFTDYLLLAGHHWVAQKILKNLIAMCRAYKALDIPGSDYNFKYLMSNLLYSLIHCYREWNIVERKRAIPCFQQLIEIDPSWLNYYNFGTLYYNLENFEEALQMLLQAERITESSSNDTTSPLPSSDIAFVYEMKQNFQMADLYHKRAILISKESSASDAARVYCEYATFLAKFSETTDAAEKLFEQALEMDPINEENRADYGRFLREYKQDYGKASKYLNHYFLSHAYLLHLMGNDEKARDEINEYVMNCGHKYNNYWMWIYSYILNNDEKFLDKALSDIHTKCLAMYTARELVRQQSIDIANSSYYDRIFERLKNKFGDDTVEVVPCILYPAES